MKLDFLEAIPRRFILFLAQFPYLSLSHKHTLFATEGFEIQVISVSSNILYNIRSNKTKEQAQPNKTHI